MVSSKIDCQECANLNCLIKKNIQSDKIKEMSQSKSTIVCKKGQQFIMQGAPINGLFFVYKGIGKVLQAGINGREQIIRMAKSGEIVGYRGFGSADTYSITAQAIDSIQLCYFSKDSIKEMLYEVPQLAVDFMLFYSDELNKSETRVRKLAQMTVRERVVDTLLYMRRKFSSNGKTIDVIMSRKEYADYAGTTEEQVIRVLSSLKSEKLITTIGKRIDVLNVEKLQKEIEEHHYFLGS